MGALKYAGAIALVLLACGPKGGGTLSGVDVGETVEAPGPAAERYTTEPGSGPLVNGPADAAAAVQRGVEAGGSTASDPLVGDARLATLASWVAGKLGEGGRPPPHEVTDFFSRHLGMVEPVPHLVVLGNPTIEGLESGVRDSVRQFLARQRYTHWGASVAERDGLQLVVVALSRRGLTITPLAREQPAGGLRLQGELTAGLSRPSFVITRPDGGTERIPAGSGPSFQMNLPATAPGEYRVEILAKGTEGDTVVANFPVYIDTQAPNEITLAGDGGAGEAGNDHAVEDALLEAVNRERAEAGLPPVARMESLDEVARLHSVDMRDNQFVGHASPTTGGAAQRVAAAQIQSGLVLENIGRGYGAAEIHRGLMGSPGHRANLLNPDVTHIGIGVVSEPEGDRRAFLATEVFVRMNRAQDLSDAPSRLVAMINDGRRARGADALEADPNLMEAAQEAAEAYFANPEQSRQDTVDDASAGLREFAIAFSRVGGLMTVVNTIAEASRLEPTFDPEVSYVGIGVAQGTRPDTPPNSIAVVILLAWSR
jgi:uncharacterized protein YkwD